MALSIELAFYEPVIRHSTQWIGVCYSVWQIVHPIWSLHSVSTIYVLSKIPVFSSLPTFHFVPRTLQHFEWLLKGTWCLELRGWSYTLLREEMKGAWAQGLSIYSSLILQISLVSPFQPFCGRWKIRTEFAFWGSVITYLVSFSSRFPVSHILEMTDTNFALR
jgi:hypothetical protein